MTKDKNFTPTGYFMLKLVWCEHFYTIFDEIIVSCKDVISQKYCATKTSYDATQC